ATFARQQAMGLLPPGTRLSPRPPWVPRWTDLDERDQRVAARFMECFAGFLSHADAQIGRVLAFIEELEEWDDTLVVVMSDNGASAEGGERGSINDARLDRKSTRLNSSHVAISYAVFCLKKQKYEAMTADPL